MSSSNPRSGLLRVLHDNNGDGEALARWEPTPLLADDRAGPAVDPFEAARHTGYEEGYLAARAETETAAESAAEADRRRVRSALADAAVTVARTRVDAVATVTAEVVELALELAQVFLQRELTLNDLVDLDAVARALGLAPTGEDLVVRLHPEHGIEVAQIEALAPGVTVKVIQDPAIERGGCVLEVGPCRIDTQIGPAIGRARALITGADSTEENPL
jgi:flagellar assembly protein FliH